MFLSKLVLNMRSGFVRRDLARPYEMHRTLLNGGFDGRDKDEFGRVLFRVDAAPRGGPPVVLVQSEGEPEWSGLPVGYTDEQPAFKPFTIAVSAGQQLRFRLRANPTKRVAAGNPTLGGTMHGKRVGLLTEADRIRWLLGKGNCGGFVIPGEWVKARHPLTGEPVDLPNFRVDAMPEGRVRNDKPGADGGFAVVWYEGVLGVTDPEAFAAVVRRGIGSAKGFGFGLLSIAPA